MISAELWVPNPPEVVFSFFGDAHNLNEITPPWLDFQILTQRPIRMEKGTIIDYKLRLRGIPIQWKTQILEWDPPYRFVDSQIYGPYQKWIHTHTFNAKEEGTVIRDDVEYAIGLGWLGPLVHRFLVSPDLNKIFRYRKESLQRRYARPELFH